jgi:hypothetical protein
MHSATPMIGVGGVVGAGPSGRENKVGVRESNQDGVCCVAEAKRVVGCPVVGCLWVGVVHQGVSLMVLLEGGHCLDVFVGAGRR